MIDHFRYVFLFLIVLCFSHLSNTFYRLWGRFTHLAASIALKICFLLDFSVWIKLKVLELETLQKDLRNMSENFFPATKIFCCKKCSQSKVLRCEKFEKSELTSVLDVHDVGEEGGDALCSALPHRVAHHSLELLAEQLKNWVSDLNSEVSNWVLELSFEVSDLSDKLTTRSSTSRNSWKLKIEILQLEKWDFLFEKWGLNQIWYEFWAGKWGIEALESGGTKRMCLNDLKQYKQCWVRGRVFAVGAIREM